MRTVDDVMMTRHVQRQLRHQRHLLHLELPASYSNRLMSKFGRNGYEASFGCGAADAAAAAATGALDDFDDGGGGGRECGSRADDLCSLNEEVLMVVDDDYEDEDGNGIEMLMGAVPTPASERANRVLVNVPPSTHSIQIHRETHKHALHHITTHIQTNPITIVYKYHDRKLWFCDVMTFCDSRFDLVTDFRFGSSLCLCVPVCFDYYLKKKNLIHPSRSPDQLHAYIVYLCSICNVYIFVSLHIYV